MAESSPDRLDRIEATLERVSQQLDNQVVVNAELRQSTTELRQSTTELRQSTTELRQTTAEMADTVNILMNSVTSLVSVVNQHQYRIEFLVEENHEIRGDMREMRSEIVGLQTENRRILEILERRE
jgi:methyl-accepting chemotaxis protein